jgi:hypothetical protein
MDLFQYMGHSRTGLEGLSGPSILQETPSQTLAYIRWQKRPRLTSLLAVNGSSWAQGGGYGSRPEGR